jgi:hypothetical protein
MTTKEKAQKYLDDNFSVIHDKEDVLYAMIGFAKEMEKQKKKLVIGNSTKSTANSYPQGTTITNL